MHVAMDSLMSLYPFLQGSELGNFSGRLLAAAVLSKKTNPSRISRTFAVLVIPLGRKTPIFESVEFPDYKDLYGVLLSRSLLNLEYPGLRIFLRLTTKDGFRRVAVSYRRVYYSGVPLPPALPRNEEKPLDDGRPERVFPSGLMRRLSVAGETLNRRAKATIKWRPDRLFTPARPLRPNPEEVYTSFPRFQKSGSTVILNDHVSVKIFRRTWSGVRTPGFGSIPAKKLPFNNHSVDLTILEDYGWYSSRVNASPQVGPDTYQFTSASFQWGTYIMGSAPPTGFTHDANSRNKAIKRLIDSCDRGTNNVALDLLEVNQLVRMIHTNTQKIITSVRSLRNGNFSLAAKTLFGKKRPYYRKSFQTRLGSGRVERTPSATANLWLELQYGWKPLLADIHGAFENLAKLNLADRSVLSVRSSASVKSEVRNKIIYPFGSWTIEVGGIVFSYQTTTKFEVRYRVDDHALAFLAQTGFTNPVNLAWEVIPFSFVADWFLPVGSFLEGLTAFQGLTFLSGSQVQFTRQDAIYVVNAKYYPGGLVAQGLQTHIAYCQQVHIKMDRQKLSAFPSQTFPTFKNPISVTHALNAIALLQTIFRG